MTVNGKPRWTCRTHVSRVEEDGVIVIEPLRNMPRIKDLVVDDARVLPEMEARRQHLRGHGDAS